jgi:hypothetical protein
MKHFGKGRHFGVQACTFQVLARTEWEKGFHSPNRKLDGVLIRLRNKMAGDKVPFSFIQENGMFSLAPFSEVGAPGLEQASPL